MSKIVTQYRWFNVDEDGGISKPRDKYDHEAGIYRHIDDKYKSEEAALLALVEYHGDVCYCSDDYTLVKTYYIDSKI